MPIEFHSCPDAAALRAAIAPWLAVDAVPYALICGVAGKLGSDGWSGVLRRAGEPLLAFACTPPWPMLLATPHPVDAEAVAAIAGILASQRPNTAGVNGPVAWTEAITEASARTAMSVLDLRLHRLVGAPQLPHPAEGAARPFADAEAPIIQAWCDGFNVDVGQPMPPTSIETARKLLPDSLAWTVAERPVAMTRRARPLHGGYTICAVYTPAEARRRGYAGATVHAQCERLLAEGSTYVALYTDLANPTSNRLYARIGFQPVLDQRWVRWTAAPGGPP